MTSPSDDRARPDPADLTDLPSAEDLAAELAEVAGADGLTVATAESLTAGQVAARLGAAPGSADWFRGSVVAYSSAVKFAVLGVPPGPVVTQECAEAMATTAAKLLDADVAVSLTGVGGPNPEEGHPAGTVWFAVSVRDQCLTEQRRFEGDPPEIVEASTRHALHLLLEGTRTLRG